MFLIIDDNPDTEIKYYICKKFDGKTMQKCLEVVDDKISSDQANIILSKVPSTNIAFTSTMRSILFSDEK